MTRPGSASAPLTPYQRFVVFAAWIGLGFDLMDSILFNFVAPIAVPSLLGLTVGTPDARSATAYWTGILTSIMLFGWALGGVLFGRVSDRIGRTRTVVLTMLVFSLGTLACSLAPSLFWLGVFRFVTALGIGGEWAAGATLVAETVPESKRVTMGALLFTSAPAGVFLAIGLNQLFTSQITSLASNPQLSWRAVMASGAVPAVIALVLRRKLKEPETWEKTSKDTRGQIGALFSPALRRRTAGGLLVGTVALITFWVLSAYLPAMASFAAEDVTPKPPPAEMQALRTALITKAMLSFNTGGLIGTIVAPWLATRFGRRPLFIAYSAWSAITLLLVFSLPLSPLTRLFTIGVVSISVYGVFGAFQFYLPELFPSHLRGTGAGFCLNTGRFLTVLGPLAVALATERGVAVTDVMRILAAVPAIGVLALFLGLGVETKGEALSA